MARPNTIIINTGDKFGAYKVIEPVYSDERKRWDYKCRCEKCGAEKIVRKSNLLRMPKNSSCRDCTVWKTAKLTQFDRAKIRELFAMGEYYKIQLAQKFNCSLTAIQQVLKKKQ